MSEDLIIIGGGIAGLSAALLCGRARRKVAVIDAGRPRNRFADHSHGVFGWDGAGPADMTARQRDQALGYPSVRIVQGEVSAVERSGKGFRVLTTGGDVLQSRRLLLAAGVSDMLPDIEGMEGRWGKTVLHCPYCHGYAFADRPTGVLATTPMAVHQALVVADWGPVTLFTSGLIELDETQRARLGARKVLVETGPVRRLVGGDGALEGVELDDGRRIAVDVLYTVPRISLGLDWLDGLGVVVDEGPLGPIVRTDERRATTAGGIYAAGDCARQPHNASFASADGVAAAMAIHMSLIEEEIARAL
ncbi:MULTISPECIES: NAD(P)/FAD-dependent oxidoreductase [unclassified Sphingomonas]|uniref:NAD(P)/FAD-dependent oxidoreductase n=1 Tax=unclassified Sphingomonas TaxID=196159 RepID=UPI0006FED22B|nr:MULTISPECIES: NAD(P)/FAD-dependent oxidoreductase [unclassified Sphingomonas]KQX23423.1 hypothetical protein ASD17_03735 [Sphingomonas sp. Root1294]KQY68274.1 hypothetical protein ASD39_06255 [Sphingomonas sp. Root50]KRB91174.1 hypothetical protein ASE22_13060 [Sphingomonas sp. Root720]